MPWRIGPYERGSDGRLRKVGGWGLLFGLMISTDTSAPADLPSRPLDAVIAFLGGIPISIGLTLAVPMLLHWGYDSGPDIATNIGSLLFHLAWWLLRAAMLFTLPALLIYKILEAVPALRRLLGIVVTVPYLVLIGYGLLLRHREAAANRAHEQEVQLREAAAVERQISEDQERAKLIARQEELRQQVVIQWRADVESAGATGDPGIVPPMLKVTDLREQAHVVNLTDSPLFLGLSRVRPTADGTYQRCLLDAGNVVMLGPHGSHRFMVYQTDKINPHVCKGGKLEFRIGTVNSPEGSWWTLSALNDYAFFLPPPVSLADKSPEAMRAQIAELERRLADTGRAERWRAALETRH